METVAVFDEIEVVPTSECILAESIEDKVGKLGIPRSAARAWPPRWPPTASKVKTM